MKVLVADDSRLHRQILVDALTAYGHEAVVAPDGIEAVRRALSEPVDLVVLDVEMPGMNGYQVAHLLKDDPSTNAIPVVFLTSKSRPGDKYWGLALGAVHYLPKTAPRDEIMQAISEALAEAPPRAAVAEPPPPAAPDEELLSRLAHVLDRRLFEAVVTSELSSLATRSADHQASLRKALEAMQRVADYDAGVMVLPPLGQSVAVIGHRVGRPVLATAEALATEALPPRCRDATEELNQVIARRNLLGGQSREVGGSWARPLPGSEGNLGAIALVTTDPRGFPDAVIRALDRTLPTLAMVVDNLHMTEELRLLAVTDGLTRTYNHRHFQEMLQAECKRTQRSGSSVCLLMADLDNFKSINDKHGHQCGDRVLAAVAKRISTQLRQSDVLARYGGEEFAILLPDTELAGAKKVAERVRLAVGADPLDLGGTVGSITISVGVAAATDGQLDEPGELVARADAALYKAKHDGRNAVRSS